MHPSAPNPHPRTATEESPSKAEKRLLAQFLAELDKEVEDTQASVEQKMTKGEALAKTLVDEALKGDQRMWANVLKLLERSQQAAQEEQTALASKPAAWEWEMLFAFFGRYEPLIKQEIERLRQQNPSYWNFSEWFHPAPECAPWHDDIHARTPDS